MSAAENDEHDGDMSMYAAAHDLEPQEAKLIAELREVVFDGQYEQVHQRVRDVITSLRLTDNSELSRAERARKGYDQLRAVVAELGPSSDIAADLPTLFALFDWSATAATDLCPALSGHFTLSVGAIQKLGTGTALQREYLRLLDDASHVGVFLLTELGYGSNVPEMETEAVWDDSEKCFLLSTPRGAACKFMPNVAANVPRVTVVAARLKVHGQDEGVFPFIVPLRTEAGLISGAEVVPLPITGGPPMDNAMIRFDGVRLPYDAWLSGGKARIAADGTFSCEIVNRRSRFHHAIEQLQAGRIAVSSAAVAAARAGLWIAVRYAEQRRTFGGPMMIERDNVSRDLVSCAARIYAATAMGNMVRRSFASESTPSQDNTLLAMLAKPLLSSTALTVLQACRERCGTQGLFLVNRFPDYLGITQGAITAEGENQVMRVAAGRMLKAYEVHAPARYTPTLVQEWWNTLLNARENALREGTSDISAAGPGSRAMNLADATAARLAADALRAQAESAASGAREILSALATIYTLEHIRANATWFVSHGHLTAERAAELETTLAEQYQATAEHLPALVAAFAIPREAIGSPIASDDYIGAWLDFAGWQ
ncbi:MAG: hypothetical protein HOQ05_10195 [Corynebacteriales bacterium]|nr:hypothetical protein [Mycobacteriales bacterium]